MACFRIAVFVFLELELFMEFYFVWHCFWFPLKKGVGLPNAEAYYTLKTVLFGSITQLVLV